jgi:hypothetical protein
MGYDPSNNDFLFEQLRSKREGVQFERILRALSVVLHQWCQFTGNRKHLYGEHSQVLTSIQFDKLANFMFRCWNTAYQSYDVDSLVVGQKSQQFKRDQITFPSPFIELPGKHGRGPARFDGKGRPIYITESVYALQNEGVFYFEVTPPVDAPNSPNDHRTTVTSGMTITSSSQFLNDFSSREIEIVQEFANSVKHLGPSEIRALGTHENYLKTVEDVVKEFTDMTPHRTKVVDKLKSGDSFSEDSGEMLEYVDEAWRKASANRADYSDARTIVLKELGDRDLRNVVENCQATPDHIWDHPKVTYLAQHAERALAVSQYVHGLGMHQKLHRHGSQKLRNQFTQIWQEGIDGTRKHGFGHLPGEINKVFVGNTGEIAPEVREQLLTMLNSIVL